MTTSPAALLHTGIPAPVLRAARDSRTDSFGHPLQVFGAEGGEMLRCCLSLAVAGADIALIAFQPMLKGGPYDEIGPVFIHAGDCPGYEAPAVFPPKYRNKRAVLRPYDAHGSMRDGVLAEPGDSEAQLAVLFADDEVDSVQVRNVIAGCWNFTVRRSAESLSDPQVAP